MTKAEHIKRVVILSDAESSKGPWPNAAAFVVMCLITAELYAAWRVILRLRSEANFAR